MRSIVDAPESPGVDVAVDLRRRERAVSEQLLDHLQVGTALEQVRRECVTETVGVGNEASQCAGVQAPPAYGEEDGVLCARAGAASSLERQLRPTLAKVD